MFMLVRKTITKEDYLAVDCILRINTVFQRKKGRQISVDKTLSLIIGIINELHVTAVK